jgi:hypothetical protein
MNSSKSKIIKEIAQELDCGKNCYYNAKTNEIVAIPDFSEISHEEEFKEAFKEELEKVENQQADFIKFEVLKSFESFKIMERFIEQMADQKLKAELEFVLVSNKPFQNFKRTIDHSDSRKDWFDFKQSELEKIVENQLNRE